MCAATFAKADPSASRRPNSSDTARAFFSLGTRNSQNRFRLRSSANHLRAAASPLGGECPVSWINNEVRDMTSRPLVFESEIKDFQAADPPSF